MNILTAKNISKNYTGRTLLNDVSFGLEDNDKVGIIGINGTGKSTLLKIVATACEADSGEIIKRNNLKIAYLEQNPILDEEKNVLENVLAYADNENSNAEGTAKSMLNKLGFYDYNASVKGMSGGEKKRIALVRTVLEPCDLLVLDEPTNHLDASMAQWLENYLVKYRKAIIMVTHDRYFLDKVTNRILEIDNGHIYSYETNYEGFLELKAQREEMAIATERKNKSLYRVELEWMMRGARARSTKQKAHIQRFEELRDRDKPIVEAKLEMTSVSSRLGKKTIEINNVSKSFGDKKLINNFSYIFLKRDRIGIIGKNGCGKSTLLKMIMGIEKTDEGTIDIGTTVKVGYFSQMNEYLDESCRVIDYVRDTAEYIETTQGRISASQMCEKFLFTPSLQYSLIGKLSGGEKRRLYLLKVLMEKPNVLILDEPTNDLDIKTMTILEDYLDSFDGIVITVSHDRFFLDRVVERIFAFDNGTLRQFEGGYSEYVNKWGVPGDNVEVCLENKSDNSVNDKKKSLSMATWKTDSPKKKLSYKEERELMTIDEDIALIERKLADNEKKMIDNATDSGKLNDLLKEKEELEKQLEYKMDRWVYLNELVEKINENK